MNGRVAISIRKQTNEHVFNNVIISKIDIVWKVRKIAVKFIFYGRMHLSHADRMELQAQCLRMHFVFLLYMVFSITKSFDFKKWKEIFVNIISVDLWLLLPNKSNVTTKKTSAMGMVTSSINIANFSYLESEFDRLQIDKHHSLTKEPKTKQKINNNEGNIYLSRRLNCAVNKSFFSSAFFHKCLCLFWTKCNQDIL